MAEDGNMDLPGGKTGSLGEIPFSGETSKKSSRPTIIHSAATINLMFGDSKRCFVVAKRDVISKTVKGTIDNPVLRLPPRMSKWTRDDVRYWTKHVPAVRELQADQFAEQVSNGNSLISYNDKNLQADFEFTESEVDRFVNLRKSWLSEENDNKDFAFSRVYEKGGDSPSFLFNITYNITMHNASDCIVFVGGCQLETDDQPFVDIPVNMHATINPEDSTRQSLFYQCIYTFMKIPVQKMGFEGIRKILDALEREGGCLVQRIERSSIRFIIRFYSQESLDKFKERCLNGELAQTLTSHLITDDDITKDFGKELDIHLTIEDTDYNEARKILSPSVRPRSDLGEASMMSSQEERDIEPDLQQDQASQQSSRVHTVRPNQPQAESPNVSITGDHSTVIVGPATTTYVNQTGNQNQTGTRDTHQLQDVPQKATEALKKVYTTTGSYVQMLPWVDDHQIHIMEIYTQLRLVEQVDTGGRSQRKKNKMESYKEIFYFQTREGNPIKRVVISGTAGIGKTVLIDKIAYDWALGNSETLNKYDFVFVLKMRSLQQSSDLIDAVFNQLLDRSVVDQSVLKAFIDKNQDKVLILLDGFDEFQTTELDTSSFGTILKVLNRKQGTECWVVTTSRPPVDKLVNSSLVEMPYTHVRVKGFSKTKIREYVNKFFPEDNDKASKVIEHIELSDTLFDLAMSPMLLLLMCSIWDEENTLPDTMTRLYNKALKYIFRRRTRDIKEDSISKTLISIGKVALYRLISTDQSFAFKEGDFEMSALSAAMNAGVLTGKRVISVHDTYQNVYFIHFTFLEYCAAMYWQSLINTDEFNRILHQIVTELTERTSFTPGRSRYDYLLRFCCGDNEACTNCILQKVLQDETLDFAVLCYFESQSKKLPPENVITTIIDSYISMMHWDNDITNAFFYLLKRVAAVRRGNDYFPKVKSLSVSYFNSQRFNNDLKKSIKLMTNLQSLFLSLSSLTSANTEKILTSLASPSKLTRLDLSWNEALGGSVSSLAPQLMKLSRLMDLNFSACSLKARDVSPIADSMGDTLVRLEVSGNPALGGRASIWGPELEKMTHLQMTELRDCSLRGKDIEPIAVALSGVSTLFHLGLSHNPGLGGCAEMWAQHLKTMRHLKQVVLDDCSLRDKDIEPIAVALSGVSTLVDLDLSTNPDLGGCAELWAQHWKKMNHLKELSLNFCELTAGDMKPIAESVSDMPKLNHLSLQFNDALGGCASSWTPHIKQMTKHLKCLRINKLTEEDKEYNTASGFNSPALIIE